MGDIWHWLWFILFLVAAGDRDDYEEDTILLNAEVSEMRLHIESLSQKLHDRELYAVKVEGIAKAADLKANQCLNETPDY